MTHIILFFYFFCKANGYFYAVYNKVFRKTVNIKHTHRLYFAVELKNCSFVLKIIIRWYILVISILRKDVKLNDRPYANSSTV